MNTRWTLVFAAALLVAVVAADNTSHATPIAYEGFDYDAGNLSGGIGGTGWGGGWVVTAGTATSTVTTPGATYTLLPTTGNKLQITGGVTGGTNNNLTTRVLSGTLGTGGSENGTVWVSVLGDRTSGGARAIWFALYDSAVGTANSRMQIGGGAADNWLVQFAGGGTALTSGTLTTVESLLLMRIDFHAAANDDFYLWVNPDLSAGEPAPNVITSPSYVGSSLGAFNLTFDTIGLRALNSNATNVAGQAMFDEIRIGTTFASVIPEPGAMFLAAIGLAGMGLIARKRRK